MIRAAEREYGMRPGIAIAIGVHAYRIEITERTDKIELNSVQLAALQREHARSLSWLPVPQAPQFKPIANGRLRLSVIGSRGSFGRRSQWNDGPRGTLETKLNSVLSEIARRAEIDQQWAEEMARRQEELRQRELARVEREKLKRIEDSRAQRLADEIAAWKQAEEIRSLLGSNGPRPGLT